MPEGCSGLPARALSPLVVPSAFAVSAVAWSGAHRLARNGHAQRARGGWAGACCVKLIGRADCPLCQDGSVGTEALPAAHHPAGDGRGAAGTAELGDLQEDLAELGTDLSQLQDIIRYAFDCFDRNGDGQLSCAEFQAACVMLGMQAPAPRLEALFYKITGGEEYFVPVELEEEPWQKLVSAIQSALMERYKAISLDKVSLIVDNLWAKLTHGDEPLDERVKSFVAALKGHAEALVDLEDTLIDLTGIAFAAGSILQQWSRGSQEPDASSLVPLLVLLGKASSDALRAHSDSGARDLSHEEASVYAAVFKPAGFTLSTFQQLCSQAGAEWHWLPKGGAVPAEDFGGALMLVGRGSVRIKSASVVPGLSETSVLLKTGSFLEHGELLGKESYSFNLQGGTQCVVAAEDTLVLFLDRCKLQRFLDVHPHAGTHFHLALASSQASTMLQVSKQSQKMANDLPLLFYGIVERAKEVFMADRATLWIHDAEKGVLWTMFVPEDGGSSSYASMDDRSGLAGHSFIHREQVVVQDCYSDPRFNRIVDERTGYRSQSVLSVPIVDSAAGEGARPVGVLQLLNKLPVATDGRRRPPESGGRYAAFGPADLEIAEASAWVGGLLATHLGRRYKDVQPVS